MKPLSAFYSRIAPRVSGLSNAAIDMAVLDAAIDFCRRSKVLRVNLAPVDTVAGVREVTITPPASHTIEQVFRVFCGTDELRPMEDGSIASPFADHDAIGADVAPRGRPRAFREVAPGRLSLYPAPDQAYVINVRAAVRPSRDATEVEDVLFEEWGEAIAQGALARLYAQPGESMDLQMAQLNATGFVVEANRALLQSQRGHTRAMSCVPTIPIR